MPRIPSLPPKVRKILPVALVLLLTVGVFVRTAGHDFIIWDDDKNIYENPKISQYSLSSTR